MKKINSIGEITFQVQGKVAPLKNIDTLTKEKSLVALQKVERRLGCRVDGGNSASAAAAIDGSPILSDSGKIYMYWIAHYRILVIKLFSTNAKKEREGGERKKLETRVRRPCGLLSFERRPGWH